MATLPMPPRWVERAPDEWVHVRTGWLVMKVSTFAAGDWEARPCRLPMRDWQVCWRFTTQQKAMRFSELVADRFMGAIDDMHRAIVFARAEVEREE